MRISDWSSDVCSSDLCWRALSKRYTKDSQTVALRLLFLCSPGSGRLFEQFRMRAGAHEVHQISLDRVDEQEVAADMALAMIAPIAFEGVVQPFRAKRRGVGDEEHHRILELLLFVAPAAVQPLPILREPLFIRRLSGERGALTAGGLLGRGHQRLPEDR